MPSPARALSMLLLVGLSLAIPLLATGDCDASCGAGSCDAHCGDCASCPFVAELHGVASRLGLISTAAVPPIFELGTRPDHPRALDHVPLSRH